MSAKNHRDELIDLLTQSREYVRYSGELGIDTVTTKVPDNLPVPTIAPERRDSDHSGKPPATAARQSIATPPQPSALFARTGTEPATAPAPQVNLFGEMGVSEPSLPVSTESLEEIWRDIGECTRCALCEGRTQVVNTHGNRKARLMFVGEAPGAEEDAQGRPFVGRAGQLLTKMIEAMGLKREDVIIGNVNRCRPPGNRQPTLEEAAICRPFLFREIAAVRPEVIVVMGNTALRNLLEIKAGISSVRGKFQNYQGIKVMPTFHPAYLLRDPSKKRETWEDLKKVMAYLESRPAPNV